MNSEEKSVEEIIATITTKMTDSFLGKKKMNIIDATKKAMELGKGIINPRCRSGNVYLLPTNTRECYIAIPIGFSIENSNACPRWNPRAEDILSEDWEVY